MTRIYPEIFCKSFEDYRKKSKELCSEKESWKSPVRMRGHADSNWPLTSTLERFFEREGGIKDIVVSDYSKITLDLFSQIENISQKYRIESPPEKPSNIYDPKKPFDFTSSDFYDHLAYMSYLRQYGCPSPLLDWSHEEKVALKFAIKDKPLIGENFSIFYYFEFGPNGRTSSLREGITSIVGIGPCLPVEIGQLLGAEYSLCFTKNSKGETVYDSYEKHMFAKNLDFNHLYKFTIPSTEVYKAQEYINGIEIEESLFKANCKEFGALFSDELLKL